MPDIPIPEEAVEKIARLRIAREGRNWETIQAGLREVALNSARYDLVFVAATIHSTWVAAALEEMAEEFEGTAKEIRLSQGTFWLARASDYDQVAARCREQAAKVREGKDG